MEPSFEPIAIVGQGCVLPGALSPAKLWSAVSEGRDLLSRAPAGRWREGSSYPYRQSGGQDPEDPPA